VITPDVLYHEWSTTITDRVSCLLLHPHTSQYVRCWTCSAKLAYDDIFLSHQQSISPYLSYKSILQLKSQGWQITWLNLLHFIDLCYISSWKAADPCKLLFQFFLLTILQHPLQNYSHASQGIWIDYFLPTVNAYTPSNTESGVYLPRFNGHHQFHYDLRSTHTIWD